MPQGDSPRGSRAGKKRPRRDPSLARRERRMSSPRVRGALAEAAEQRAKIEALLARQSPAELYASVTVPVRRWDKTTRDYAQAVIERPVPEVAMDDRAEGDKGWTVGQARLLYMDGYSLDWVVRRTGWGAWWFSDLTGADGYAVKVHDGMEWSA